MTRAGTAPAKTAEIIARVRARVRLHAQPREVVHGDDDRQTGEPAASSPTRSAATTRRSRARDAAARPDPIHAAIESPRIDFGFAQLDDVDAVVPQRVPQSAHVLSDSRCRADGQLRVERNPHESRKSRSRASTMSACGSSVLARSKYPRAAPKSPRRYAMTPSRRDRRRLPD